MNLGLGGVTLKVAIQLTLFTTGLLVVLIAGFFGLIDIVGHENVVLNLLLLPLTSTVLTVMYSRVYDFVEGISFKDVSEPLAELKTQKVKPKELYYNH